MNSTREMFNFWILTRKHLAERQTAKYDWGKMENMKNRHKNRKKVKVAFSVVNQSSLENNKATYLKCHQLGLFSTKHKVFFFSTMKRFGFIRKRVIEHYWEHSEVLVIKQRVRNRLLDFSLCLRKTSHIPFWIKTWNHFVWVCELFS